MSKTYDVRLSQYEAEKKAIWDEFLHGKIKADERDSKIKDLETLFNL